MLRPLNTIFVPGPYLGMVVDLNLVASDRGWYGASESAYEAEGENAASVKASDGRKTRLHCTSEDPRSQCVKRVKRSVL